MQTHCLPHGAAQFLVVVDHLDLPSGRLYHVLQPGLNRRGIRKLVIQQVNLHAEFLGKPFKVCHGEMPLKGWLILEQKHQVLVP